MERHAKRFAAEVLAFMHSSLNVEAYDKAVFGDASASGGAGDEDRSARSGGEAAAGRQSDGRPGGRGSTVHATNSEEDSGYEDDGHDSDFIDLT